MKIDMKYIHFYMSYVLKNWCLNRKLEIIIEGIDIIIRYIQMVHFIEKRTILYILFLSRKYLIVSIICG